MKPHLPLLVAGSLVCARLGSAAVPALSAREIVVRSIHADNENTPLASKYTYQEREVTKELDGSGKVKSTKTVVRDVFVIGGKDYRRVVEREGKPLAPGEAAAEQRKIDRASADAARLSDAERERRLAEYEQKRAKERERLEPLPDAYDWTLGGTEQIGGRDCFVLFANPKASYRGKYANLLRNMRGKIWIDTTDYEWVRVEAEALSDISFGLFLARLSKGSQFAFEQSRVNNEVWLPKLVRVHASARALVKRFNIDEQVAYGNYKKFSTDAKLVGVSEAESK